MHIYTTGGGLAGVVVASSVLVLINEVGDHVRVQFPVRDIYLGM